MAQMKEINIVKLYEIVKKNIGNIKIESNGEPFHGNITFNFHNGILINANVGDKISKINQNIK